MELIDFKRALIGTGLFKQKTSGQFVCKECPFCGDVKYHMYVLIKLDNETPVLYNCFKCNSHGIMNSKFLEYYNLDLKIPRGISFKKNINIDNKSVSTNISNEELFDYTNHEGYINRCREYIYSRIGVIPTDEEMKMFGIINDPFKYYKYILGGNGNISNKRAWFRCTNGAIIGRDIADTGEDRWVKRKANINSKLLYSMRTPFDTGKVINIIIAEGVFDCIGLFYHYKMDNAFYIACLGRDYMAGIKHILDRGIYGDSVCIKIFKDNDVNYVQMNKYLCDMFKEVHVYHNMKFKDYGTNGDNIEIEKCQ